MKIHLSVTPFVGVRRVCASDRAHAFWFLSGEWCVAIEILFSVPRISVFTGSVMVEGIHVGDQMGIDRSPRV